MTKYHRFTQKAQPMSDWAHAMLCIDETIVAHYGDNHYTYTTTDQDYEINIENLIDIIAQQWDQDLEDCHYLIPADDEDLTSLQIANSFNPENINDSAGGYDYDRVEWLYNRVIEPMGISVIILKDGCIVFDADLISKED